MKKHTLLTQFFAIFCATSTVNFAHSMPNALQQSGTSVAYIIYTPITVFECQIADNNLMQIQLQGHTDSTNANNINYSMRYLYGKPDSLQVKVEQNTKLIEYAFYATEKNQIYAQNFIMSDDTHYYFIQFNSKTKKYDASASVTISDKTTGNFLTEDKCTTTDTVSNFDITKVTGEQFEFIPMGNKTLMKIIRGMPAYKPKPPELPSLPVELSISETRI